MKCDKCNGTGLADYERGRQAEVLCDVCEGSGKVGEPEQPQVEDSSEAAEEEKPEEE